jgi:hypothetical protein
MYGKSLGGFFKIIFIRVSIEEVWNSKQIMAERSYRIAYSLSGKETDRAWARSACDDKKM